MLRSGVRASLIAGILAATLPSQERRPLTGRVVGADGKPVTAASVILFHTPPGDATGAGTERVDVQTDEHGRFVAKLLPQLGYSAFALGPGEGDRMVSEVQDLVATGANLELRLGRAAKTRPIVLTGADQWATEVVPNPNKDLAFVVHGELICKQGINNHENLDFTTLIADKKYQFVFVFSPAPIKGATGSNGGPMAIT